MSNRLLRVRELLKREIGSYISKEIDFQNVLVSIHDVDVTPNLKKAHVHVGVIGDQNAMAHVLEELQKHRGAIQSHIGKRVTMKFTPKLEFHADDSVERGVRVLSLLEEIAHEDEMLPEEESE